MGVFTSKKKISLSEDLDLDRILKEIESKYSDHNPITIDGVKIEFESSWVHLRKSNTEPIVRVYTEAKSEKESEELAERFLRELQEIV